MSKVRDSIVNSFSDDNPESLGVFKALEGIYPAFSKKIFENNPFMKMIVMTNQSPMHILDYPICGKCETLAMWDRRAIKDGKVVRACGCFANGCGHRTIDPITFRDWLKEELRHKAPPTIVENIEFAVDAVAMALMKRTLNQQKEMMKQDNDLRKYKSGLVDANGNSL